MNHASTTLVLSAMLLFLSSIGWTQVTPPTNLHDSVPFQGHPLLFDPVVTEFQDDSIHRFECDWPEMMRMIRDIEVKLGQALEEEVYREYMDKDVVENRVYMSYNCYALRDSIISLQIELDEALESEPVVLTLAAIEIASSLARLKGQIIDDGNLPLGAWGFRYGTDSTMTDSVHVPFGDLQAFFDTSALDTSAFSFQITDLARYTTYYFTAVGTNAEGAGYGDTLSFTTLPELATGMALDTMNVEAHSALLKLNITDAGGQGPDSVGFFWDETDFSFSSMTGVDSLMSDSASGTNHSVVISGLTRYTDYYFNAYADNLAGRATAAANFSFKTLPDLAIIATPTWDGDSLHATITDAGGQGPDATSFVYSASSDWTNPLSQNATHNNGEMAAALTDLDAGKRYYAAARATNIAGTANSDTIDFATPVDAFTLEGASNAPGALTMNGAVSYNDVVPSSVGFKWAFDADLTAAADTAVGEQADSTFTATLNAALFGNWYHYAAHATNEAGTSYGDTIAQATLPQVVTLAADSMTTAEIKLRGEVVYGNAAPTSWAFLFSDSLTSAFDSIPVVSANVDSTFSLIYNDLEIGTKYYVAAVASNAGGVAYGDTLETATKALSTTDFRVSAATDSTAVLSGSFEYGNAIPTEVGVLWSYNADLSDSLVVSGVLTSDSTTSVTVSGLLTSETVYYAVYAVNMGGTSMGEIRNFCVGECPASLDYHGVTYSVVRQGCDCWMGENLATTQYRDGTDIALLNTSNLATTDSGAYVAYDNDAASLYPAEGLLYNVEAMTDERGICPTGWHVPNNTEWIDMEIANGYENLITDPYTTEYRHNAYTSFYLHHLQMEGIQGTNLWYDPNFEVFNSSQMGFLPGGYLNSSGNFVSRLQLGNYLVDSNGIPHVMILGKQASSVQGWITGPYELATTSVKAGSIRCIQDSVPGLPAVMTAAATSVDSLHATLNGEVLWNGWGQFQSTASELTATGFLYSTDSVLSNASDTVTAVPQEGAFALTINTAPYTDYYFVAFATNDTVTAYGDTLTFKTLAETPELADLSYHHEDRALSARVTDFGGVAPDSVYFKWGESVDFSAALDSTVVLSSDSTFSVEIEVLPGKDYYAVAYAANVTATGRTDTLHFMTPVDVFTAVAIGERTDSTAVLSGSVFYHTDYAQPDSIGFRWSRDPDFEGTVHDTLVSFDQIAADSTFSLNLGFDYGKEFTFQAIAVNGGGMAYGSSQTFCAGACPETLTYQGTIYDIVRIGCECYFAENLATQTYVNGDSIPALPVNTPDERIAYQNNQIGVQIEITDGERAAKGGFYNGTMVNYAAIEESRKFCPAGWNIINYDQFANFSDFITMTDEFQADTIPDFSNFEVQWARYKALKSSPTDSPAWDGSNSFGFSVAPHGYYAASGQYLTDRAQLYLAFPAGEPGRTSAQFKPEASGIPPYNQFATGDNSGAASIRCVADTGRTAPFVFSINASNTTPNSATLNGLLGFVGWNTSSQVATVSEVGFIWADSANIGTTNMIPTALGAGDSLQLNLSGLTEDQTYWFRAYAINENDTAFSSVRNFVAAYPAPPTVTTHPMSNIKVDKFMKVQYNMTGELERKNNGEILSAGWKWSTSPDFSTADDSIQVAGYHSEVEDLVLNLDTLFGLRFGNQSYPIADEDLLPGTTYYYFAFASNEYGTGYGDTLSVYIPMGIQTGMTAVTDSTIDVHGILNYSDSPATELGLIWSLDPDWSIFRFTPSFISVFDSLCVAQIANMTGGNFDATDCIGIEHSAPNVVEAIDFYASNVLNIETQDFQYDRNKRLSHVADTVYFNELPDSSFIARIELHDSIPLNTPINFQVFAKNAHTTSLTGRSYVTTGSCFDTDYFGMTYTAVKIHDLCWFTENLRNEQYNDGDSIPYISFFEAGSSTQVNPDWYTAARTNREAAQTFRDSVELSDFGRLYSAYALVNGDVCPVGTHVATYSDWNRLYNNLDDYYAWLDDSDFEHGFINSSLSEANMGGYHMSVLDGGNNYSGFNAKLGSFLEYQNPSTPLARLDIYGRYWLNPIRYAVPPQIGFATFSSGKLQPASMSQIWKDSEPQNSVHAGANAVRCVIDDPTEGPRVNTGLASAVSDSTATIHGSLDFAGWRGTTDTGFEWGYDADLEDATTVWTGVSNETFSHDLTDLNAGETIYYRALAKGALEDVSYGEIESACLINCDAVTFNGHTYQTVAVGCECWFAEDLVTTQYNDGTNIDAASQNCGATGTEACWGPYPEGGTAQESAYIVNGGNTYYTFGVASNTANGGICPTGWSIPDSTDWDAVVAHFNNTLGTSTWAPAAFNADGTGFGQSVTTGSIDPVTLQMTNLSTLNWNTSDSAYYWLPGDTADYLQKGLFFGSESTGYSFSNHSKWDGLSVRCLRDQPGLPQVATADAVNLTGTSAKLKGQVAFNWDPITATGFKWSLQPDLSSAIESIGSGLSNEFTADLSGLTVGDTVYFSAFATNSFGTSFGDTLNFVSAFCTSPTWQGHTYNVVEINGICIFSENLQTEVYANGDTIPYGLDDAAWSADVTGAVAVLNGDESNVATLGRLYNKFAIFDERGLCPTGWSVPITELNDVVNAAGGFQFAGDSLKATYTAVADWVGDDIVGFNALPSGTREPSGNYIINQAVFATSMKGELMGMELYQELGITAGSSYAMMPSPMDSDGRRGSSVRCIKSPASAPSVSGFSEKMDGPGSAIRLMADVDLKVQTVEGRGFILGTNPELSDGVMHTADSLHAAAVEIAPATIHGTGRFSVAVDGLNADQTYYYCAYAENANGRGYSDTLSFIARNCQSPTLDGHTYEVTYVNSTCWFGENLKTTTYANGDPIVLIGSLSDPSAYSETDWVTAAEYGGAAAYQMGINGDTDAYGLLYSGTAVLDERGLCPSGWEVPNNSLLRRLVDHIQPLSWDAWPYYLQVDTVSPTSVELLGFMNMGIEANDVFEFTALNVGSVVDNGMRQPVGMSGAIWSANAYLGGYYAAPVDTTIAVLELNDMGVSYTRTVTSGHAIRCIQSAIELPEAVTVHAEDVTETSATLIGLAESDGNDAATSFGFIWGTAPDLTGAAQIVSTPSNGVFASNQTGLTAGETYYYVAFASNNLGTHYGDTLSVTPKACTSPTHDGYTYDVVRIGEQCWFSENLQTDKYANGDAIPGDLDDSSWSGTTEGAQAVYNNDQSNVALYGRIYNLYAVTDSRGLCPVGWHVPTEAELLRLAEVHSAQTLPPGPNPTPATQNGSNKAGSYLNQPTSGNEVPTSNLSGYSAIGAGARSSTGQYLSTANSNIWSSSIDAAGLGRYQFITINGSIVDLYASPNSNHGNSVRCLAD